MTIDHKRQLARQSGNMEFFSPDINYSFGGDHSLPNSELPMYAASPNSLYLYEQERSDMQNLGNNQFLNCSVPQPKVESICLNEEFDLNPSFETNYDSLLNVVGDTSDLQDNTPFSNISAPNRSGKNSDVTLSELNLAGESESFLEDLESVLPKSGSSLYSSEINMASVKDSPLIPQQQTSSRSVNVPFSNFSPFIKTEKTSGSLPIWNGSCAQRNIIQDLKSTVSQSSKSVAVSQNSQTENGSSLYKLLKSESDAPENKLSLQSLLMSDSPKSSRPEPSVTVGVKRSAPPSFKEDEDLVDEKWEEIKKYIHNGQEEREDGLNLRPTTREKRTRFNSGSSYTAASFDDSDEDDSSDEEWSDTEVDMTDLNSTSVLDDGKKGEKYFWQYNVQSKGPKGTKVKLHLNTDNPHKLPTFEDPVFDPQNTKTGIRHGGKARKGDGNDIVPSPKKLFSLGQQIKKLNHMINEISANTDQPLSAKNEAKKRKNKLASRSCRLKKKAQHEANKVKLWGLRKEHGELLMVIQNIRTLLIQRARELDDIKDSKKEKLVEKLDELIQMNLKTRVGGCSAIFVNNVIRAVENGDPTGGIQRK